ncbi:phospho-sugar mutase [Vibrio sp. SM6]|uniref:Phospho-sugar mutase n=1 Tax=Vibrio agarilyticus TaxID=2726741 RepID=A0A7X8YHP2_9VIBR|nr:phospho-sugar mutase [Vibrio agarilyticus]NLS13795.1 phospho-sugar mutase [Vibrio agarilyticus]
MDDVKRWLSRDPDPKTQRELQSLIDNNNQHELTSRFKTRLAFGTAGLRGEVGAGPNRMNRLVIQETATGLGHYLLKTVDNAAERGVVVGFDGRIDSRQFAHDTAGALAALGIKVFLTADYSPTPLVAFGVRHFDAAAAVVVTASHNPPQYNGFKVYWENGAQIIPPHDAGIAECIEIAAQSTLTIYSLEQAEQVGRLEWLRTSFYDTYRDTLLGDPLLQSSSSKQLSLAYTAMHGVGAPLAEHMVRQSGYRHFAQVNAQRYPDGTFPTVNFPNPEEPGAMDKVIALAEERKADLACANDPDADRFAVAAPNQLGHYQMLTGDQVGCLLGDYALRKHKTLFGTDGLVGNTIVSSRLLEMVARGHGAPYYQTLTGFKWLTNVAMEKQTKENLFVFAYEEALGYTIGNNVWDKDGLSALIAFLNLADELRDEGKTVWDQLEVLYRQHGFYLNAQRSIALSPETPPIGDLLRQSPPKSIANSDVVRIDDLKSLQRIYSPLHDRSQQGENNDTSDSVEAIDLPASDVLIYFLKDHSRVIVRPSGTEPKIKCYYEVICPFDSEKSFSEMQAIAETKMAALIHAHQGSLPTH